MVIFLAMADGGGESRGGREAEAADDPTARRPGSRRGEAAQVQGRGDRAPREAELGAGGAREEPVRGEPDVAGRGAEQRGDGQRAAEQPRAGIGRPGEGGPGCGGDCRRR